jgi:hypothetical protein
MLSYNPRNLENPRNKLSFDVPVFALSIPMLIYVSNPLGL